MKNVDYIADFCHKQMAVTLVCLIGIFIFSTTSLLAQRKSNFAISNNNLDSDWDIRLRITDASSDMDCWGTDTYRWTAYRDGTSIAAKTQYLTNGQKLILSANGINSSNSYYMYYKTNGSLFNCLYWKYSNTISITTKPLKAPIAVIATDSTSVPAVQNKIKITWGKGTDVPNGIHHYYIARDYDYDNKVHKTGTEVREYIDNDVNPGEIHTYSIWTWVASSTYGNHQSDTITVTGSTLPQFSASDGQAFSKTQVKIIWPEMHSNVTKVKILKENVEIQTISDMAATRVFYDDNEVIPGFKYEYSLVPYMGTTPYTAQIDTGFARPNGRIKGFVKAPFGGPVEGAIVYAERTNSVPQGENQTIYADTTDASGAFDLKTIYYYTEADFKVFAEKGEHGFEPATHNVTLDLQYPSYNIPSPSFIDTSSFTLQGKVAQLLGQDSAAVEGVEILVNDVFKGTITDELGQFLLTVEEIGEYKITPRFLEHSFDPQQKTFQIEADVTSMFFEDTEKDTLKGYF